ncbi:MAG: BatD family protein [Saprospiraceae bacterium]|nr:BatD family protein [Saprospiraceae bacterium]
MKSFRFLFLLCLGVSANAQNVEFNTYVENDSIELGEVFKIEFELKNAQGSFDGPDLSDFYIVGGPNYASSYSIINGKTDYQMTYSYILEPKSVGKFIIGKARVEADGRTLESDPVEIVVISGSGDQDKKEKVKQKVRSKRKPPIKI